MITLARVTTAVILAAGRGSRMRRAEPGVELTREQRAAADAGWKALMPIAGRPFLEHTLAAASAAGVERVVLVTPRGDESLAARFAGRWIDRRGRAVQIHCVVQQEPMGTADALLACRASTGDSPFLLLNSDNYYPHEALEPLVAHDGAACLGLDVEATLADGRTHLARERYLDWALLETDTDSLLVRIVEKPTGDQVARLGPPWLASPNAWRFTDEIFRACEAVAPSSRGELELPAAVQLSIDQMGGRYRVLPTSAPILDLGRRSDIPAVEALLERSLAPGGTTEC